MAHACPNVNGAAVSRVVVGGTTFLFAEGVDKDMTCRFDGACCGYICVAPHICRKKESDLTDEDKRVIEHMARRKKELRS